MIRWNLSNFAAAYIARQRGDRSENLEIAITAFKDASEILTRETTPFEWAQVMNNLGSAYLGRTAGDRLHNIENAIDCLMRALIIRTRKAAPLERASTLENLAIAYSERIVGLRTDNLKQGLEHSAKATRILSRRSRIRYAEALIVKAGILFLLRTQSDRYLDQAIRTYRRALRSLDHAMHPLPWARAQVNLAIA